jgi:hypothetical protein
MVASLAVVNFIAISNCSGCADSKKGTGVTIGDGQVLPSGIWWASFKRKRSPKAALSTLATDDPLGTLTSGSFAETGYYPARYLTALRCEATLMISAATVHTKVEG